jgi:hypothetical protein
MAYSTQPLPKVGGSNLKPPVGALNDGQIPGQPSINAASRGIVVGTSVGKTNSQLAHVCDFVLEMQKNIQLKEFLKAVANTIREGIRAIMRLLGLEPTGQYSWLIDKIKTYARELKRIRDEIIQPIIIFERYVLAYITKLRAIVQWILGLPARFIALLKDCLTRLLKLIGSVFSDFFKELSPGGSSGGIGELVSAAKELTNEAYKTVNLAGQAAVGAVEIGEAATAGLLIPVSQADLDGAANTIINYTGSMPSINTAVAGATVNPLRGKFP